MRLTAAQTSPRTQWAYGLTLLAALILGGLIGWWPALAVGIAGLAGVVALAFLAPAVHLTLLVAISAIAPYEVQNTVSLGGGAGAPGLLLTDLLLVTGLARATLALGRRPLERRRMVAAGLGAAFLALVAAQAFHGLAAGHGAAEAGFEARVLFGWATLLVAMPIISHPSQRRRLLMGLAAVGMATGAWGLVQWLVDIPFGAAGDAGVRDGVGLTTGGRGQVQGGLFAFPVSMLIALAVLVCGQVRSFGTRAVLVTIVLLNLVSILLTYERTFWVASALGIGVVALRAGRLGRVRVVVAVAVAMVLSLPVMATIAPQVLTTARERLLSLGQYGTDPSVRARLIETRHVWQQIARRPLLGSGLGATAYFGRPYEQVSARERPFAHNALLWLWWKLGPLGPLLVLALVVWAVVARGPPLAGPLFKAVRDGAQAALLAMLAVSVTFPSFVQRPITPTLGVLVAISLAPVVAPGRRPEPG